ERPVVLVGEMWRGLIEWMRREMVSRQLMNANDLDLVTLAPSIDEAVVKIERHKEKFDAAREQIILERRRAARAANAPPAVEPVAR
ncbi:MAG TPA: hypothetical protein VGK08_06610, partial [Thermoanaerobaculia bacterium]